MIKSPLKLATLFTLATIIGHANAAQVDLITFEPVDGYLPDGSLAVDNAAITTQYRAQYGVSFGLDADNNLEIDSGSTLRLEDTSNTNGNWGYVSTLAEEEYNNAESGYESQLGDWFLTNDRDGEVSDTILIQYDNPVTQASGEIWDIDGRTNGNSEQWQVSAYDQSGNLVENIESPIGVHNSVEGSLDSKPWLWSFDVGSGQQIMKITMQAIGNVSNSPVAFNNFATASVGAPEPQFWAMLTCFGLISLFVHRRRTA
jgi:hypothetical protein